LRGREAAVGAGKSETLSELSTPSCRLVQCVFRRLYKDVAYILFSAPVPIATPDAFLFPEFFTGKVSFFRMLTQFGFFSLFFFSSLVLTKVSPFVLAALVSLVIRHRCNSCPVPTR
jgi:hypothetical protein